MSGIVRCWSACSHHRFIVRLVSGDEPRLRGRWGGFGNALNVRFWIDTTAGGKAGEPERNVRQMDFCKLSIVGGFVFPLLELGCGKGKGRAYGEVNGYVGDPWTDERASLWIVYTPPVFTIN